MAVAFTNIAHGIALKAMQTGTFSITWSLTGLTTGRGLLIWCGHDQGGTVTFDSTPFTTSGAGAPTVTAITPAQTENAERHGQWCYATDTTATSFDFIAHFVNGNNIGAAQIHVWQVTGHNTSSMIGSSASDFAAPLTTLALSGVSANSGIIVAINDDNSYSNVTVSGSLGGSYTKVDTENTAQSAYDAYKNDIGASGGTETLTFSGLGTVYMAHAIEVKVASGGPVAISGSAITCGIGSQVPSIAVPL